MPTLTLRDPSATAARSWSCGTPDEPCRTSGTGTASRGRRDEVQVELGGALGHRVAAADGYGERVDAGRRDELRRLVRVGAHAGAWRTALAADVAELGLHQQPASCARRRPREVRATFSRSPRAGVEHHRAEPSTAQPGCSSSDVVGDVVEVQRGRRRGSPASSTHGRSSGADEPSW